MADWTIRAEALSKSYRLGTRQSYQTLRESMSRLAAAPWQATRSLIGRGSRVDAADAGSLWALRDASFQINAGEIVGVIGRNGAGKSTLLKILSRITDPTCGWAEIRGRVGSLLEVGTGFHPELTGRENIFLNGAILGMKRSEIVRKFDQIVAFAAVERFIDTAVKHYSSGMYLRLAFAVAAHLEPEILLVDEVLAVGDASFQNKCLGRMEEVVHEGRTVLFVSHNMGAVRSLCAKGIFLEEGHIAFSGDVNECIQRYFQAIGALAGAEDTDVGPTGRAGFGRVSLLDASGNSVEQSRGFAAGTVLRVPEGTSGFYLFCILEDMQGRIVFHLQEASPDLGLEQVEPGDYVIRLSLPPLWLVPGLYTLHFKTVLWGGSGSKYVSDKFPVDVGGISSSSNSTHCFLHPGARWNVQCATAEAAPIA